MPSNLTHKVEQLRQQFLESLPQRAHQIDELWRRLRYLKWSSQGIQGLHTLVHRLAGSGASFGAPEVSERAKVLDIYLQEHITLDQPFGGVEREMIDQMITSLIQVLNQGDFSAPVKPQPAKQNLGSGQLIFVVDDDDALSALIATYLRANGFEVKHFTHPQECIQHLQEDVPQAILMDIGFHGEDMIGLDAIEHIKIQLGNAVPIIMLSARTDMHARLRALRAGCAHYVTKPVDFSQLLQVLAQTINQHPLGRKIMVVDDDEPLAQHLSEILRDAGTEVLCVNKPLQTLQHATKFQPDLVILDMHMPEVNGIELAKLLRSEEEFLLLPIIFITADTSQDLRQSLESLGVNGVLNKPIDIDALKATCIKALAETTALKNRVARVTRHVGYRHQITRSYFFDAIDNALQQPETNESTALYYIGSDAIAELLEDFGQTGIASLHEQLCQTMAKIIGDEEQWVDISNLVIAVLAGRRSEEQHQKRATQLIAHIRAARYEVAGETLTLNTNTGISYLNNELGPANSVLRHAEQDYEKNKQNDGKENAVEAPYKINYAIDVHGGNLPVTNLRMAYQPMISLEDDKYAHYEALIRWRTDADELIPAGKFLHNIENTSVRIELDRWVLQSAVTALMANSNTRENADLFIHLTEDALKQKSFLSFIANVLRSSRLRGDKRIIFMLKESWIAANMQQASAISVALRDINCGICMVHAGETPNGEKIIQTLSVDYVKLMPQLTANIQKNNLEIARIKAFVAAANQVNAKIIATQVENSKNLASLWQLGVRLFQGYFIQSPDQQFHARGQLEDA